MEKRGGIIARFFRDIDLHIAILCIILLVIITLGGVVMRYFFNRPLTWLEEVQLACLVWIVFLGACGVARKTGHIAIDAFVGLFPRLLRNAAKFITHVIIILTLAFFSYNAILMVRQMWRTSRSTNILEIPYWLIYAVVPAACIYMIVNSVLILTGAHRPEPPAYAKEADDV